MSVQIKKAYFENGKDQVQFTFADKVYGYVVGIQWFYLTYGTHDHNVQTVSIGLTPSLGGKKENIVSCTVSATLCDATGHTIDPWDTRVDLVCIASLTDDHERLALENQYGIEPGGESSEAALPDPLSIGSAFVSGFDLSFAPDDNNVRSLSFVAGLDPIGARGRIAVRAGMEDASGHSASKVTVDAGLVAVGSRVDDLMAQLYNELTDTGFHVDFGADLSSAAAMIQSYTVSYGEDDHNVETISGGVQDVTINRNDSTRVDFDGLGAFIKDDTGHSQDDGSNISLVVFAIPKS